MTHTVDTLMELAYKIRDALTYEWDVSEVVDADKKLRAALAELVQAALEATPKPGEPVACVIRFSPDEREPRLVSWDSLPDGTHHLYTVPPAQTPPRLTDGLIKSIASTPCAIPGSYIHAFARAIEADVRKQFGVNE
jgi:hypothetical protein